MITFVFFNSTVSATTLDINKLGQYDIVYRSVNKIDYVFGNHVLAKVTEKKGANFSVFLPFSVQQVIYLVANGEQVTKNQKIAYLKGYDVHHFLDEFDVSQKLFYQAKSQYNSSKQLFKNKALSQSAWLEISKNYFQTQLRFEHLNHFKSFLSIDEEHIAIIAPVRGYVRFTPQRMKKQEGELIFDVIPTQALRLQLKVTSKNIKNLDHLEVVQNQCRYAFETKDKIVDQFFVSIWSQSIEENRKVIGNSNINSNNDQHRLLTKKRGNCSFTLGESLVVSPVYKQSAYKIVKSAVFEFNNKDYIAVKNNQELQLVEVTLINSTDNEYIFTSEMNVDNKQVATSSLSAIQGVLLELGGE